MNDIEKLKKLFDELGIGYTEYRQPNGNTTIRLTAGDNKKVVGYLGFYAAFEFEDGAFVEVGVWE